MRNLKKFLALVMAMVMAFSLMLTVNAAHIGTQYTDEDDVTPAFEEAMEVLTGMGVYQGDPGATFRPASTITRAETAALIYRLATGDTTDARKDLYKDYGNFADVTSADWFAGYVGYCANAGYIKGHGGYFNPYGQVTGYEVLAMVLRAVGYDKNHEFEGATWQTNVSALSTQLNILKQVKSTHYGDRLYEPSRRDVVASLLFETAANVNMVNYTAMAGYNKYTNLINNELNPTLGYKNFGLTYTTGIVVGNQATGEDKETVIGIGGRIDYIDNSGDAKYTTWNDYAYPGTQLVASGGTADGKAINVPRYTFDFKTGLDLFGHKVKAWYDGTDSNAKKTYALFDKAELAATVKAATTSEEIDKSKADDSSTDGKIALAAKKAGFTIPTTSAPFYESVSFSHIGTQKAAGTAVTAGTVKSEVWVLISNNDKKTVDVVIPVEVTAAQITKVDNWSTTKTITLDHTFTSGKVGTIDTAANYNQDAFTSDASKFVLGDKVIAVAITDRTDSTTSNGSNPVYWLDTVPAPSVTGKVVDYNTTNHTVTLDNGTVLKRTIIADTAINGLSGNYGVKTITSFTDDTYAFTLDMQGNWLHAEKVYDNTFIYGTYLDYGTELGSSSFTYKMVGVDLNGEVVTKEFSKYNKNGTAYTLGGDKNDTSMMDALKMPFHSTGNSNSNDYGSGLVKRDSTYKYRSWIQSGKTMVSVPQTLWSVAGVQSLAGSETIYPNAGATETAVYDHTAHGSTNTVINKDSVKMSVVQVPTTATVGTNPLLYLTENTKFIVVSGYGTDSVKPVVYNGISELLGSARNVTIKTSTTDKADEIFFTESDYVFSNTGVISKQVNTMILPKDALEYANENVYFIHDKTSNVKDAGGEPAKKYTAYVSDEKVSVWINDAAAPANANQFYMLQATDKKAADGEVIYNATLITTATSPYTDDATSAAATTTIAMSCNGSGQWYSADTTNGQTAILSVNGGVTDLVNIANAKVVNFSSADIKTMADLNGMSSLLYQGADPIRVCVLFDEPGSKIVDCIYVIAPAIT